MTRPGSLPADALVFDAVSHRYGPLTALSDVSFVAPAGQVTAILGQSGSGKSTLLRLAAGLERPDAGRIQLGARVLNDAHTMAPAEKRRIAMVFQDFALFPHLSLAGNVGFGLDAADRATARALAGDWLARVGLGDRLDAYPHQLSGGEQQRVALVRALASSPRAVLLDEPFSGLDRALRLQLRDTALTALREAGVTAVFVTHDADDAMYAADQIIILHTGRLVQMGAPRAVYDQPNSLRAALGLGSINTFDGVARQGCVQTPFGAFACTLPDGAPACVGVRHEALRLTPGTQARVRTRRPAGGLDSLTLEAGGALWIATVDPANGPYPDDMVDIGVTQRGVHVFNPDT